jgi:hypothetical protein
MVINDVATTVILIKVKVFGDSICVCVVVDLLVVAYVWIETNQLELHQSVTIIVTSDSRTIPVTLSLGSVHRIFFWSGGFAQGIHTKKNACDRIPIKGQIRCITINLQQIVQ